MRFSLVGSCLAVAFSAAGARTMAETDSVDDVNQSLVYSIALQDAGGPTEMHLYANGGHAFGLRRTGDPITEWPRLVERWLRTIGIITGAR